MVLGTLECRRVVVDVNDGDVETDHLQLTTAC